MGKRRHHRGRRIKKKKGSLIISNIILICAVVIFCVAGFKLFQIGKGYMDGRSEYEEVIDLAIDYSKEEEKFRVDFDKLLEINEDTIGWIRFNPEPSIINYPLVQGKDNDIYLRKTFSANENTLGSIFLDVNCSGDLSDRHSIIYGHRMKDGSMFRKLEEYKEKSFWEENPYFYIYTPDGREITYQIYSTGVVEDTSDTYLLSLEDDTVYQEFINYTFSTAEYETGIEVTADDQVITLSTCTASSDEHRYVVHGVKIREAFLEE